MFPALMFPQIDPVLVSIGPLAIRWYALAYIVGLLGGWALARALTRRDGLWGAVRHPTPDSLDDLLMYAALGVVFGGRLGEVLFWNFDYYLARPAEIVKVWNGGMSFHGGLIGAAFGVWLFARKYAVPALPVADLACAVAPIGIFLGRIANFIKPELWGRPTDVPWAMVFPGADDQPRHPSQLYEAALEGLALFVVVQLAVRAGAFRRPGLTSGLFALGYGLARIVSEFFREPDGYIFGVSKGAAFSLPLVVIGLILIARAKAAAKGAP